MEALVLTSEFHELFSDRDLDAARMRLEQYGFDVRALEAREPGPVLPEDPQPQPLVDAPAATPAAAAPDVVLVGCVKTKRTTGAEARDLYVSALFDKRRRYAESTDKPWYILSALHGLIRPETLIEPYDVYLASQPSDYRRAWGEWVAVHLQRQEGELRGRAIEIHAGSAYVEACRGPLERRGATIRTPLSGLGMGQQLRGTSADPMTGLQSSRSSWRTRSASVAPRTWMRPSSIGQA